MNENPFYDPTLRKRHRSARIFKWLARSSILLTMGFLLFFLFDMLRTAAPAVQQAYVQVEITYSKKAARFSQFAVEKDYRPLVSRAWLRTIPKQMEDNPALLGTSELRWVLADDQVDQYLKGHHHNLKQKELDALATLQAENAVELQLNNIFFNNGDSKLPEFAGIQSAIVGSILTLLVTMVLAFPLGVMTAVYLEEFAKDNPITHFIEVNINNLAAIPSILFGLLGLSVFINLFGLPRSSPLVGGMTLALMTLPII
ncbi:MAG: DUF3333 domain-containing protein, partial [Pseudomonadales bacterium]|nr:DUF3333 domain-containing protein [Pseudomonadales bacterium]